MNTAEELQSIIEKFSNLKDSIEELRETVQDGDDPWDDIDSASDQIESILPLVEEIETDLKECSDTLEMDGIISIVQQEFSKEEEHLSIEDQFKIEILEQVCAHYTLSQLNEMFPQFAGIAYVKTNQ